MAKEKDLKGSKNAGKRVLNVLARDAAQSPTPLTGRDTGEMAKDIAAGRETQAR